MVLKVIYTYLFLIGLFLIPFNNFSGYELLREYKHEPAIYFWIIGIVIAVLDNILNVRKIIFPKGSILIKLFLIFIGWVLLTYLLNFQSIQGNFYKGKTGNERFFSQFISLIIPSIFLVFYFWNVCRNWKYLEIFKLIRKILLYSFLFVFCFSLLEYCVIHYDSTFCREVIYALNNLPFINKEYFSERRLSSVSFETPALGNFLIFSAGWLFSYYLTTENKIIGSIPGFLILVLVITSGARAAFVIVLFQFLLFLVYVLFNSKYKLVYFKIWKYLVLVVLTFLICFSATIIEKLQTFRYDSLVENNISNQTRFGMQYASLKVFMDYPMIGVGYGQNTFYKRFYYPDWAIKDNYEFTNWYLNENIPSFPSDFNLYTRLLAEVGLIGFLILFLFLFTVLYYNIKSFSLLNNENKFIGIVLFIGFIGLMINWLQLDYFRQFGFWILLILLIKVRKDYRIN